MNKNEQKVHELLEVVMKQEYTRGKTSRLIQYAQTYARKAITDKMTGEELRVQILYILGNLSRWRGKEARETKARLNKLVKIL